MKGIAALGVIPIRREQSERSEMVSQILFGEMYEVLEVAEKWLFVRLLHDGYEGWIDAKMSKSVTDDYAKRYIDEEHIYTTETFSIVKKDGDFANMLIAAGSVLPLFDIKDKSFKIGDDAFVLLSAINDVNIVDIHDVVISSALSYYNSPYLWGGRTPMGIDCSGLIQMVFRAAGVSLKRDASMQVLEGEDIAFFEESRVGDLAFFGDSTNAITHVGIIWEDDRIIHSSGKVRIDKIDHQGIYNEELKRYTHSLKVIKRLI